MAVENLTGFLPENPEAFTHPGNRYNEKSVLIW
jgi:hypothetical protein